MTAANKTRLNPNFKLWLTANEKHSAFGDGKWLLLDTIDSQNSLSAACRKLNISYRKAWGDIKKAEAIFRIDLVEKHRGGQNGGYSKLTPQAKELIKAYRKFHLDVEKSVNESYRKHLSGIKK